MSLQLPSTFHSNTVQYQGIETTLAEPAAGLGVTTHIEFSSSGEASVLERLAKALVAAGVSPEKLDRRAENEKRLSMVARLFELSASSATELEQPLPTRRGPCALPKWRLKRVADYVDAHISEPISLASLAAAAGMSRMYFASQFKVATGMRPHDYLLQKRIERAQDLLRTTSEPLVEIALSVGFQTQAHFSTIFKKITGNTPLRWRREQQA